MPAVATALLIETTEWAKSVASVFDDYRGIALAITLPGTRPASCGAPLASPLLASAPRGEAVGWCAA
ncbi:hypothetical protein [Novosphingobium pentaromativorans]|uniref:Uncharacterized protein n=1 Tax=Novosphingobium pentaromativorans US6-1 TaxID=1088721 RepID=G6E886_9SPHN|nr:hypothetical protein [Novosphingobium pentaromativorans]AIT81422.1 hypothetical protein JI59_17325 [Novosphingobium pentaromativorans US6-1]EHJ62426.1 hypothetical protein NSU_0557 [Novosphingobium pentaromativorans US6-1]